jgi:hypothetical protein
MLQPSALSPDFERGLKGLVSRGQAGALQAGRVSIIGLDEVKQRLGPAWERLSGHALRIARNTIERYLLPGDIFTTFGEAGYVIVFSSLDTERARMKCLLIADEVMKAILGEDGADLISVGTAVAQLNGSASLEAILAADLPLELQRAQPSAPKDNEVEFLEVNQPTPSAPDQAPPFGFRPMWDTATEVLSTYLCTPTDSYLSRDSFAENPESLLERDLAMQRHGLDELTRAMEGRSKVLIGISVHFETLAAGSYRRKYLNVLHDGLPREATKFLVIEIMGFPDGVPQSRILDLITPLKRYCRAIVVRVPIETADFAAFDHTGVASVGCDVGGVSTNELAIIQLMTRFNRNAEKVRLATYARGLRSASLMAAAVGAGFRYIQSDGIRGRGNHPLSVVKFNLRDMYRELLP